jgi:hypothetical protein
MNESLFRLAASIDSQTMAGVCHTSMRQLPKSESLYSLVIGYLRTWMGTRGQL